MLLLSVSVPSVARTRHSQTDAPVLISSSPDWVLSAFVDGPAHCSMGQRSAAQQECFAAASEAAQHEGRKVHGRKVVNGGPEGVVPSGCSYSQVSSAAIFNTHRVGGLNSRRTANPLFPHDRPPFDSHGSRTPSFAGTATSSSAPMTVTTPQTTPLHARCRRYRRVYTMAGMGTA